MNREYLHRKLLLSYLAVVAAGIGASLIGAEVQGARPAVLWSSLLLGATAALLVALALSALAARRIGSTLTAATADLRRLAAGRFEPGSSIRYGSDDEIDELLQALGEARRALSSSTAALAGESEKLRTVLDGMAEGVALLAGGRIRFANRAFTRLLDVHVDVEGRTPLEAVRRAEVGEAIAAVGSGAKAAARDLPFPSGRILQLRARPLSGGASVVVLLDVTEARSLERLRREFVANASHELRTPVAAIQAVAETLVSAPSMSSADRLRFEQILLAHAGRLSRLVNDLLDLSRVEAGLRHEPIPVELGVPIATALASVRQRAEDKKQRLCDSVPAPPPRVVADPTAVEQVLANLLENAVKYTPEGGQIDLRVVDKRPASRVICIEVEDSGVGIPPEHLGRIFERFYRVDPSRSRDQGGTGLGLAIVKHLVQSYGGEVSVTSKVGVGSIFRVTLPAA